MVYWKELERCVTTKAKALLRLKSLVSRLHRTWSVQFFFCIRRTNKGWYVHAMCKMLLVWAKTGKTSAYFLRFHIKLKSNSGFDLVTVLISKQSFFQHRIGPVQQGKSDLHGIAFSDFYIALSFFYKNQIKREYLPLLGFSVTMPLPRKFQDVTKEQIYVNAISQ